MRFVLIFLILGIAFECHVVKRQAINDVFRDVVRQKTRGNQIQQCPCVIHPESRQCISYDSRYIAVNYEEAILSFLDLSKHHVAPAPLINSNTFSCTSQECQQCFSLLYHKLGDIGFIPSSYRSSISPLPQNQLNPSLCPRYNFPIPIVPPVAPSTVPSYLQSLINAGRQFRSANPTPRPRSNQGSPPAASPHTPPSNRNNNQNNQNPRNQNQNHNQNPRNQNQNQNNNGNQNQNRPNNNSARQNSNQNNQNNQLQNQRTQFRNNQAMRNRFNAQQRASNAFQNAQRQFQPNQNNFQRPWQGQQQQQFQQPQFQNPRPFQNFNGQQQHWNGRFWEPAGQAITEAIRNPIQNAVGNGWSNGGWGGGQQGNSGSGFPQAPVVVQPAPAAPAPVQPIPWTGGGGDGFGGGGHFGGGWGGGGGQNQNNQGGLFGLFGGFKSRHKRAVPPPPIIGQRFTINCMARGDSEDDMLALCGSCWTWRQLPDNYFPRIINELSCKPDDFCLSGWGECVQQYRNVDVLRRDNGRWVPTVITTSTCCDCRVRAGTEIHSLVIGDKH